jgi:hypothetical protein
LWNFIGANAMTISNDIHTKSEHLLQQLRGLEFIVDANKDVLDMNPVSKEFIGFKMDIARNFIEELQLWEELGNPGRCNVVFEHAQFFIEQAQVLTDRILDSYCEESWLDYQRTLRFTRHTSTTFELFRHFQPDLKL